MLTTHLKLLICRIVNLVFLFGVIVCLALGEGVCTRRSTVYQYFENSVIRKCGRPFPISKWSSKKDFMLLNYIVFICTSIFFLVSFVTMIADSFRRRLKKKVSIVISCLGSVFMAICACIETLYNYKPNYLYSSNDIEDYLLYYFLTWIIANGLLFCSFLCFIIQCHFSVKENEALKAEQFAEEIELEDKEAHVRKNHDGQNNETFSTDRVYNSDQHYSSDHHYGSDKHYSSDQHYSSDNHYGSDKHYSQDHHYSDENHYSTEIQYGSLFSDETNNSVDFKRYELEDWRNKYSTYFV